MTQVQHYMEYLLLGYASLIILAGIALLPLSIKQAKELNDETRST